MTQTPINVTVTGRVIALEQRPWTLEGRSGVKSTLHLVDDFGAVFPVTVPPALLDQQVSSFGDAEFGDHVAVRCQIRLREYDGKRPYVELVVTEYLAYPVHP